MIEDALIYNGKNQDPFRGDIGVNISKKWEDNKTVFESIIADIGDLSITSGQKVIKGDNLIVTPGLIMLSDNSIEETLKKGITTPVRTNNPKAKELPVYADVTEIGLNQISSFTSDPAKILNLEDKGIIDINNCADLIIFNNPDPQKLLMSHLIYVIKNGQVVYQK
jgi:hypothetical protein